MNALLTMDGRGPSSDGNPRFEGLLGVARDSVCLDMALSESVGLGPVGLDTIREARRRGLGKPWSELTVDGCRVCANACPIDAITFPSGLAVMNRSTCISCLCCHELCPENAVELKLRFNRF